MIGTALGTLKKRRSKTVLPFRGTAARRAYWACQELRHSMSRPA